MEAQVRPRMVDDVAVLDVAGELDLYTSPKLKAAIDDVILGGHTRVVVNLLETTYLDSTALAVLNTALQDLKRDGGTLSLIFNQPQIGRLFAITGLNEVFPIFPTEAEALHALGEWKAAPPRA